MPRSIALGLLVLALSACGKKPGGVCVDYSEKRCVAGGEAEMVCADGRWKSYPCRGPSGCKAGATAGARPSCDDSVAMPGDPCDTLVTSTMGRACTPDHRSLLVCAAGTYARAQDCNGAGGCEIRETSASCDVASAEVGLPCVLGATGGACSADGTVALACTPPHAKWEAVTSCRGSTCSDAGCLPSVAREGDACLSGYLCGEDGQTVFDCVGGKRTLAGACRGPRGCVSAPGRVDHCDQTLMNPGDPCKSDGGASCSPDGRELLVCRDGGMQEVRDCTLERCHMVDGGVWCRGPAR